MEMTKGVGWIYGKNEGFRFSMEDMNGFRLSMEDVKMTSRFYRKEVEIIHDFFPLFLWKNGIYSIEYGFLWILANRSLVILEIARDLAALNLDVAPAADDLDHDDHA